MHVNCATHRHLVTRREFDLGEGRPSSTDLGDDLLGRLVPDERLGVIVPVLDPRLNGIDEGSHAVERAAPEAAIGQLLNQRSTRLSQLELVGMKCRCQRARLG